VIVADTGAIVAMLDRRDRHHHAVRALYLRDPDAWVLPWAILPEVDYLARTRLGSRVHHLWLADLAAGAFAIRWGTDADLAVAHAIVQAHRALDLGLVDAIVMAAAERLRADIATLDLRDFGAVRLKHVPRLLPRDLSTDPAVRHPSTRAGQHDARKPE
jgi:predicted nucleic acid-binding protein